MKVAIDFEGVYKTSTCIDQEINTQTDNENT